MQFLLQSIVMVLGIVAVVLLVFLFPILSIIIFVKFEKLSSYIKNERNVTISAPTSLFFSRDFGAFFTGWIRKDEFIIKTHLTDVVNLGDDILNMKVDKIYRLVYLRNIVFLTSGVFIFVGILLMGLLD